MKTDPAVVDKVVGKLLPDIMDDLEASGDEEEEIAGELRDALKHWDWDGYALAKRLDNWNPSAQLVETLDRSSSIARWILAPLVKEWAKTQTPRFSVGERVKLPKHIGGDGEVTKIDPDDGSYTVFSTEHGHVVEGLGCHGFVINWEQLHEAN